MTTKDRVILLPYTPRNWARKLHESLARWIVLVIHRRGGKTTAALNHLIRDAMLKPNTRYAYIAPTIKQARRIVWAMAKYYTKTIPGVSYNASPEMLVNFPNGSELMIIGSDSPDSIRGIGLWGCFLDEYPQQSPIVFTEIITKCLADHLGYCIFGGTPKGKGHFFKVFATAQKDPEWCLVFKNIDDSLKEETGKVINNLRQALEDDRKLVKQGIMTQDEFEQEWYNSFEAAIKGAIYRQEITKARAEDRITKFIPWDMEHPVYTVWDLGINKGNQMSIGFYQHIAGQPRMIDYYENIGEGFPHYIKHVKSKPYIYGKHFAPHDIKVRELGTGKTRYDTAEKLGLKFELDHEGKSAVPRIGREDGIDKARAFFNRIYVCVRKCATFLDVIGMYHRKYDEIKGVFLDPVHDFSSNAADQFRYAALVEDQMHIEIEDIKKPPEHDVPADEYTGTEDPMGHQKHPMLKDVDIGLL